MDDHDKAVAHAGQIISGGMAAVALATVIQLLQLQNLSWQLVVALCCFALAIPMLVFCFTRYTISPNPRHVGSRALKYFLAVGGFVMLVGLVFIVFNLSVVAGVIFSSAIVAAVILEFVW